MPFCSNCGEKIENGAKFCYVCGAPYISKNADMNAGTVYEGKLVKCPNCGERLESFQARCPSCGYEIRKASYVSSTKILSRKLEAIEAQRPKSLKRQFWAGVIQETDEQKISLIKNFPIPNTREDVLEFLNFAAANSGIHDGMTAGQKEIAEVWSERFKYAYEKAKLLLGDSPELRNAKEFYDSQLKANKKKKKKDIWSAVFAIVGCFAFIALMALGLRLMVESSEKDDIQLIESETSRLEMLVDEIQTAIDDGDYLTAKIKLASLVFICPDSHQFDEYKEIWREIKTELENELENAMSANNQVTEDADVQDNLADEQSKSENKQESAENNDLQHSEINIDSAGKEFNSDNVA